MRRLGLGRQLSMRLRSESVQAEIDTQRLASNARRRARISLTPLIDVVFILLVFFMLASSFLDWRSIDMGSTAAAGSGGGVEGALLVEVQPGSVRFAGEVLSLRELQERIGQALADQPSRRILLRPRPGVSIQRMVTVLDGLRQVGAENIALMPGRKV